MLCRPVVSHNADVHAPSDWYVIYTRHQHEKIVAQILTSKGFDPWLPLYQTARRWKDRTKLIFLPLFPCYVFLNGGLERRREIMTTPGIHALVSTAGEPATVPPGEIEAIRRVTGSGARVEPHPFWKWGDWVRVKTGPLVGVEGILVRKKTEFRLVVSVEILGRSAAVEVDVSTVERASPRSECRTAKCLPPEKTFSSNALSNA
jgi:transcription antitermination factor NusG